VIGADGFGFVWDGTRRVKVPHTGGVEIGSDVEIGVNTAIDRATSGETLIGDGVKIDNLVQVGHNTSIGAHSVLAALVGVSGSVTLGERVVVGGQSGFADHLTVGDDVVLAGRTGLFSDLLDPGEYFGLPPKPIGQAMRTIALQQKLPDLVARIRALEEEVERLKRGD
jgi:UDP-3-O-[3-hydroxymyristoyl] glucosamine N-acyltransferase